MSVSIMHSSFIRTAGLLLIALSIAGPSCHADEPAAAGRSFPGSPHSPKFDQDAWSSLIRSTILAVLPSKKVQDKHWGHKANVLSRYEIKTKAGQLKIRPRTKEVNHGFWQRHTVTMLDPGRNLQLQLRNIQRPEGAPWTFAMEVVLRARVNTEFEHWVYGVKGLNGQVDAEVTVAADLDCSLDLTSKQKEGDLLPTLQLVPTLHALHLKVRDIDARQVGILGGWAAEEIGDSSRSTVNTILHESEDSILKDIQRQIDKQRDKFAVSPAALLNLGK